MRTHRNLVYFAVNRGMNRSRNKRIAVANLLADLNRIAFFYERLARRAYMLAEQYRDLPAHRAGFYLPFAGDVFALGRVNAAWKT